MVEFEPHRSPRPWKYSHGFLPVPISGPECEHIRYIYVFILMVLACISIHEVHLYISMFISTVSAEVKKHGMQPVAKSYIDAKGKKRATGDKKRLRASQIRPELFIHAQI